MKSSVPAIANNLPKKRGPKGPSKYTPNFINSITEKLEAWIKVASTSDNPEDFWLGTFDTNNNVRVDAVDDMGNENFSATLKKAKQMQTNRLVSLGLQKKLDVTMVIFSLKNVSGWRDSPSVLLDQATKTYVQIYRPEEYTDKELASASRSTNRSV